MNGLTAKEVAERQERGAVNKTAQGGGRSYTDIIRTNLFSFFNNILYAIGILLIVLGELNDAVLSVGLGVFNAVVGTIQETRAKWQLDQIAVLNRPTVIVIRDAQEQTIDPAKVVQDDYIVLRSGEQAVVDGRLLTDTPLEMDEALLTGESDLIPKRQGDAIRSGSFCVTGEGVFQAEKVGTESYANQIAVAARTFSFDYTPLQSNVNFVVRMVMLIVGVMSAVIFAAALLEGLTFSRLVEMAAVLTGLVPYGLFTMIVVAYAVGAAKIARQGALVQQSNAVEALSNVDVLCMDKTGTLTANKLQFHQLAPLNGDDEEKLQAQLGRYVRSGQGWEANKTSAALAAALPGEPETPAAEIPFASKRKWSALGLDSRVYALGALEMLTPYLATDSDTMQSQAAEWADGGLRVLLFARSAAGAELANENGEPALPPLEPLALVSLRDELRPYTRETIADFAALGIDLKIISGDNAGTVAALARQAGLPVQKSINGPELAERPRESWGQIVRETAVFGRITPDQKRDLVDELIGQGHYVAMIGDGVNDVLSLKTASVGIAMQGGSQATRNVADMVLLNDSFAALRPAFAEGQNIIGGLSRAMYLFLVRVTASALIIIAIAMMELTFPFEPAQVALTLFTVGIPAFCLTLWSRPIKMKEGMMRSLARFVLPAALVKMVLGIGIYTAVYYTVLNRVSQFNIPPDVVARFEAYTGLVYNVDTGFSSAAATIVAQTFLSAFISYTAFVLIIFLEPPGQWFEAWSGRSGRRWPAWMAVGLWLVFTVVAVWEPLSSYFSMVPLQPGALLVLWGATAVWALLLRYLWRSNWLERTLGVSPPEHDFKIRRYRFRRKSSASTPRK